MYDENLKIEMPPISKKFMNLSVYNILNGRGERYHRGLALPEGVEQDSAKATAAFKIFFSK